MCSAQHIEQYLCWSLRLARLNPVIVLSDPKRRP